MRKWEYLVVTREVHEDFEAAANRHGENGWELVNFIRVGQTMMFSGVFKREMEPAYQGKVKK